MQKNPPKLNRLLTAASFRHHPLGVNLPFAPNWTGSLASVLAAYTFTPIARLDLVLKTPLLIPDELSAKLSLFIFERIRIYAGVQGLHTELLYRELKRALQTPSLCSEALVLLQRRLSEVYQNQTFETFTLDPEAPTRAIVSCCSWWDYSNGAFASLLHLKKGLPLETWEAWVEDCVKFLLQEVQKM